MKRMILAAASIFAAAIATTASAATYSYGAAGAALPDTVDFSATITAPDAFTVGDVNLTLNGLLHTYWADLDISLSHGGVSVLLTDENGGYMHPNGDYTFDDQAALGVASIGVSGGSFRPLNALSAFNGMNGAGEWTLRIVDDAAIDAGSFGGWTLAFSEATGGVPEPAAWALMILGFGAAGVALRRRREAAAG